VSNRAAESDSELDLLLAQGEARSQRRTIVVMLVYLGMAFAVLYVTAMLVAKARQDLEEAQQDLEEAQKLLLLAEARRSAVNDNLEIADAEVIRLKSAHKKVLDETETLEKRKSELKNEVTELKRDRARLLNGIADGRAEEIADRINRETGSDRQTAKRLWNEGYEAFNQKHFPKAEALYKQSIAADETYAPPYNSLGRLAVESDDAKEAERYYLLAIHHRDYYAPALYNMALLRQDAKKWDEAREWVDQALAAKPGYKPARKLDQKLKAEGY